MNRGQNHFSAENISVSQVQGYRWEITWPVLIWLISHIPGICHGQSPELLPMIPTQDQVWRHSSGGFRNMWAGRSPWKEGIWSKVVGASSWVLLQGWALQGGKEAAETEGGTKQAGRMELWENVIVMCSSLKKRFMNPSDVPRCSPPTIPVLRGWAAPEIGLYPVSLLPFPRSCAPGAPS